MNSIMLEEAQQTPSIIRLRLGDDREAIREAARCIRHFHPEHVVTIARGSSDHAASFLSYALSSRIGLLCSSLSPSLITLHQSRLNFGKCLALAVSQSGASPDLCLALERAREGGAYTLALINQPGSALEQVAHHAIQIGAGEERGIAATKTFIASLVSALLLLSAWDQRIASDEDFASLPDVLSLAALKRHHGIWDELEASQNLIILSRGLGFPIAQEVALKFNEVCRLHALAYSTAEFRHGPLALIRKGDPVLIIGVRGPELPGIQETAAFLRALGARVLFLAPEGTPEATMTYPLAASPLFDPVVAVQALYPFIAQVAAVRGLNPDQPLHLRKVTRTY